MANYTGKQSMLSVALGRYSEMGYSLVPLGDDAVVIQYMGADIRSFDWLTVTFGMVRDWCYQFQAFLEGLVDF
jgi:hypothetical protein